MKNKTLIADLRKQKGLTQEKLADISGLNVRTIQRLESGEDASLETLRSVAVALKVEVAELFESVSSEERMEQIEAFSVEQRLQVTKRKAEEKIFSVFKLGFFCIMLFCGFFINFIKSDVYQSIAGILWLSIFLLGFAILKYLKYSWWEIRLLEKYPLTADISFDKNKNGNFLWWNDKPARTVMFVFWGAVIPLIFILKYAVHLF
ncbi:helix-turn-helix domain-containing protein [Enterococcus faecium]|uniref:helix-turn-helix domain-containing protein n=2 Tax=Lactobacillales TaxID=186826 RepID=UPI002FBECB76